MPRERPMPVDPNAQATMQSSASLNLTLSHSGGEDYPTPNRSTVAYNLRNRLPSDRGYISVGDMAPITRIDAKVEETGSLGGYPAVIYDKYNEIFREHPCQQIMWMTTEKGMDISVALCEHGLFLLDNAFSGSSLLPSWHRISSYTPAKGVYYNEYGSEEAVEVTTLWTHCYIDDRLYMYRQGSPHYYVLTGLGDIMRWKDRGVDQVSTIYTNEEWGYAVSKIVPTFLNMDGQVGIFRAANRLGFWDSENSISWSSSIDKMDFKPDVKTGAGVTKFSGLTGVITLVLPMVDGFVIYTPRSVTLVAYNPTSQEKWVASTISQSIGVSYYNQVVMANPEDMHFFWDGSVVQQLFRGQLQPQALELSDMIKERGHFVQLSWLANRYLSLSIVDGRETAITRAVVTVETTTDANGNLIYRIPAREPQDFDWEAKHPKWAWQDLLEGRFPYQPQDLEPLPYVGDMSSDDVLIPCYTGWKYVSPFRLSFKPKVVEIPNYFPTEEWGLLAPEAVAQCVGGSAFMIDNPYLPSHFEAAPASSQQGSRFIDKAGEDFQKLISDSLTEAGEDIAKYGVLMGEVGKAISTNSSMSIGIKTQPNPDVCLLGDPPPATAARPFKEALIDYASKIVDSLKIDAYGSKPDLPLSFRYYSVYKDVGKNIPYKITAEVQDCSIKIYMHFRNEGVIRVYGVQGDEPTLRNTLSDSWIQEGIRKYPCDGKEPANGNPFYFYGIFREDGTFIRPGWMTQNAITKQLYSSEVDESRDIKVPIFQAELSGFGNAPRMGSVQFSFRKTHSVSNFRKCSPANVSPIRDPNAVNDFDAYNPSAVQPPGSNTGNYGRELIEDGYDLVSGTVTTVGRPAEDIRVPYPTSFFWNRRIGVSAPYYPDYNQALIYDSIHQRWGSIDISHRLLYSMTKLNSSIPVDLNLGTGIGIIPMIRVDFERNYYDEWYIKPKHQGQEGFLGVPHLLGYGSGDSSITYGRLGVSHSGFTRYTGISITVDVPEGVGDQWSEFIAGSIIIRAYLDNATGGPILESNDHNQPWPPQNDNFPGTKQPRALGDRAFEFIMPHLGDTTRWKRIGDTRSLHLEIPFNLVGRFATVTLVGLSRVISCTLYGVEAGRTRYYLPPPPENRPPE